MLKFSTICLLVGAFSAGFLPTVLVAENRPCAEIVTRAVFVNPSIPESKFFSVVTDFMRAAACDLGVRLDVRYAMRDQVKYIEIAEAVIGNPESTDYLILINKRNITPRLFRLADSAGLQTVLFNGSFTAETEREFRQTRTKLKHWVGSVVPDEQQSGYLLAEALGEQARRQNLVADDGKIHFVAINGTLRSYTSIERARGLQRYIDENSDTVLHQIVSAYWEPDKARDFSLRLLRRYPETTVIWSASDGMAVAALDSIREVGAVPGRDILIAGIDWSPVAFRKIEQGEMLGSVGGHIFDGAWLMVLLLDHASGNHPEFIEAKGSFSLSTIEHLRQTAQLLSPDTWPLINFKAFSRTYGNVKNYAFGADSIARQLQLN